MARRQRTRQPQPVIDYARMARQFPENGLKLLLENPRNVQEFLPLSRSRLVPSIDCEHLQRVNTTFVQRDYSHVACDLLYAAPFRTGAPAPGETLLVYLLIEQQSKPEDVMPLRGTDYVTEIYRKQARDWFRARGSWDGIRLQPVLPVLFYTGTRRWDDPGRLSDLVLQGQLFRPHVPDLSMCYVNLRETPAAQLAAVAGFFGRVLHVVQQRQAPLPEFAQVLAEEVSALEALREEERGRWLELLSYLMALVYHDRAKVEHNDLQEMVEVTVHADPERQEVHVMGQTMAQYLEEKGEKKGQKQGRVKGLQDALLLLLEAKFGTVPSDTEAAIRATTKLRQLKEWVRCAASAATLKDVEIGPPT
jgi:hypothetical protein